jgi:hypothetical protein
MTGLRLPASPASGRTVAPEQVSAEAARLPIAEIAIFLRAHLGRRMTAYISGVNDPKMVARWVGGQSTPRDHAQRRLREAYQATRLLVNGYGDETAKAWLSGSNAQLDDQAPAFVLRNARSWEDLRLVVPAARAFVTPEGLR